MRTCSQTAGLTLLAFLISLSGASAHEVSTSAQIESDGLVVGLRNASIGMCSAFGGGGVTDVTLIPGPAPNSRAAADGILAGAPVENHDETGRWLVRGSTTVENARVHETVESFVVKYQFGVFTRGYWQFGQVHDAVPGASKGLGSSTASQRFTTGDGLMQDIDTLSGAEDLPASRIATIQAINDTTFVGYFSLPAHLLSPWDRHHFRTAE